MGMSMGKRSAAGLRDAQQEPAAGWCGWCGGEVYAGEPVYCPEEGVVI